MRAKLLSVNTLITISVCILLFGCGPNHPETVPVNGKITLDGGEWPIKGMVIFTCDKPADGFPKRAGKGIFDLDGTFTLTTFDDDKGGGLMPGHYKAMVICGEDIKGMNMPGKSYVPIRYQTAARSGIELTVEPGSGPIDFSYNVTSK